MPDYNSVMRIVLLTPVTLNGIGGIETLNSLLIEKWRNSGHEITVWEKKDVLSLKGIFCCWLNCIAAEAILVINATLFGRIVTLCMNSKTFIQHNTDYVADRNRSGIGRLAGFIKFRWVKKAKGIAVSKLIKEKIPNVDVSIIQNPLPASSENSRVRKLKNSLLFVGRLSHDKGLDLLLNIMPQLPSNTTLTVIGAGPEGASISQLVDQLQINDRVFFLGEMTRNEVLRVMSTYRVIIVPSRMETFGFVAAEALALGMTLVASNAGNLGEMFFHPRLTFDSEDRAGLLRSILFALELGDVEARRISKDRLTRLNYASEDEAAQMYIELFSKESSKT